MEKSSYLVGAFRKVKGRIWGEYYILNATSKDEALSSTIKYVGDEEIEYTSMKCYCEIDIINMKKVVLDKMQRVKGFDGITIKGFYYYNMTDNYEELHKEHRYNFDSLDINTLEEINYLNLH